MFIDATKDHEDRRRPNHGEEEEPSHVQSNPIGVDQTIPSASGAKLKTKLRNGKDILNYEPPLTRYQARWLKDALLSFVALTCGKIDYGAYVEGLDEIGNGVVTLLAFNQA